MSAFLSRRSELSVDAREAEMFASSAIIARSADDGSAGWPLVPGVSTSFNLAIIFGSQELTGTAIAETL